MQGHKPIEAGDQTPEYNVTHLSNGFTVLTESKIFPGAVHMGKYPPAFEIYTRSRCFPVFLAGFMIDVGARDETPETSGSLLALRNTYLKTLKHTNETINYGMIQMSGGEMEMNYDQEKTYFGGHCIEYDVIDLFQMMVDIALEPRSVLAANVARSKNRKSHDLAEHLLKYDPFARTTESLLRTAYGYNTLGMPLNGLESNIDNIDARVLQKFLMDNVTPRKCLIVGAGVDNHQEFVELVKERIGELLPVPEQFYERSKSEYIGGEYRTWTETPNTNVAVAFEGVPWSHEDAPALWVVSQLLGNSAANGGIGLGGGRLSRLSQLQAKNAFIDKAYAINANFTDSGLFGLAVEGAGSQSKDLMGAVLDELSSLKMNISDEVGSVC